jgi:hypothetical protein
MLNAAIGCRFFRARKRKKEWERDRVVGRRFRVARCDTTLRKKIFDTLLKRIIFAK